MAKGCHVGSDEEGVDLLTLFIEYPTVYPSSNATYIAPRVNIEAGAR